MNKKRYVFDLDNTLIYTDKLNNISYNYALKEKGLLAINDYKRITRDNIFVEYPDLSDIERKEIIEFKQKYFITNLEKTIPNKALLSLLEKQNTNFCILWTSANNYRAKSILKHYNIHNKFKEILVSDKSKVLNDVNDICELFKCNFEQLVFYEDDLKTINCLKNMKLNVIAVL